MKNSPSMNIDVFLYSIVYISNLCAYTKGVNNFTIIKFKERDLRELSFIFDIDEIIFNQIGDEVLVKNDEEFLRTLSRGIFK